LNCQKKQWAGQRLAEAVGNAQTYKEGEGGVEKIKIRGRGRGSFKRKSQKRRKTYNSFNGEPLGKLRSQKGSDPPLKKKRTSLRGYRKNYPKHRGGGTCRLRGHTQDQENSENIQSGVPSQAVSEKGGENAGQRLSSFKSIRATGKGKANV